MSGYDFSPLYRASCVSISPGSTFLATSHVGRVIIRSTNNLSIIRTWHITSSTSSSPLPPTTASSALSSSSALPEIPIDSLQWSDDGLYVLAFSRAEGIAWVFGLAEQGVGDVGEIARIDGGGVLGLDRVEWAKGGREVLGFTEYGSRMTVYSLSSRQTYTIQNVKSPLGCHTYSSDNRYLAIVERYNGKDCMGIYDTADQYQLIRNFPLQATDVQSIHWSPDGKYIAVVDSCLSYSLYVYSPIGPLLTHFSHTSPTFSPLPGPSSSTQSGPSSSSINPSSSSVGTKRFSTAIAETNEDPGLGIRELVWAPGGRYMVLNGWDGKVRVVEVEGWRCLAVLAPGSRTGKGATVWKEPDGWVKDTRGRGIVQFDRVPSTSSLPTLSSIPSPTSPPYLSTSISPSGRHMLYIPPTQPCIMHIYTFLPSPAALPEIKHRSAVIFAKPVRSACWSPASGGMSSNGSRVEGGAGKERIGVITRSNGAVYVWDEEGWEDVEGSGEDGKGGGVMEGIGIPNAPTFSPLSLQFSPDGTSLALQSKGEYCMMYDTDKSTDNLHVVDQDRGRGAREWDSEGLSFVREEDEEGEEEV